MVVTGGGSGCGNANSTTYSPAPTAIGADDSPRRRRLHPRTGSQKYSASLIPSSRGRNCSRQCQSSCSASRSFQSMSMRPTLEAIADSIRPQSVPDSDSCSTPRPACCDCCRCSRPAPTGPAPSWPPGWPSPPAPCAATSSGCATSATPSTPPPASPAATGSGPAPPCRPCSSTTTRPSRWPSAFRRRPASRSPASPRPRSARWPSWSRCCPPGCATGPRPLQQATVALPRVAPTVDLDLLTTLATRLPPPPGPGLRLHQPRRRRDRAPGRAAPPGAHRLPLVPGRPRRGPRRLAHLPGGPHRRAPADRRPLRAARPAGRRVVRGPRGHDGSLPLPGQGGYPRAGCGRGRAGHRPPPACWRRPGRTAAS